MVSYFPFSFPFLTMLTPLSPRFTCTPVGRTFPEPGVYFDLGHRWSDRIFLFSPVQGYLVFCFVRTLGILDIGYWEYFKKEMIRHKILDWDFNFEQGFFESWLDSKSSLTSPLCFDSCQLLVVAKRSPPPSSSPLWSISDAVHKMLSYFELGISILQVGSDPVRATHLRMESDRATSNPHTGFRDAGDRARKKYISRFFCQKNPKNTSALTPAP